MQSAEDINSLKRTIERVEAEWRCATDLTTQNLLLTRLGQLEELVTVLLKTAAGDDRKDNLRT